jgi:hypothetical protein
MLKSREQEIHDKKSGISGHPFKS